MQGSARHPAAVPSGAVSGNNAIVVGYKGGLVVADQTETQNDDSYIVIVPAR